MANQHSVQLVALEVDGQTLSVEYLCWWRLWEYRLIPREPGVSEGLINWRQLLLHVR